MSSLRARCPACRTLTAVAIELGYECHVCGRTYGAGLVRVPRAWGLGGEAMAAAAHLPLPFPEAAVVDEGTLAAQVLTLATDLPARPLVLGGCCCAHVGAVEGLIARHGRVAVVWLDAHGDLNTPQTSPSGNQWGMPLRMLLDNGTVRPGDVALVGARNLDPAERELVAELGLEREPAEAIEGAEGVYVALDGDVLDSREVASFMPEPGGLTVADVDRRLAALAARGRVLGAGLSGLAPEPRNVEPLGRLCAALGLA